MTIKPTKKAGNTKNEETGESQKTSQIPTNRSQNRERINIQQNQVVLKHKDNASEIGHFHTNHSSAYEEAAIPSTSKRRVPYRTVNRTKLRSDKREQREQRERTDREHTPNTPPVGNSSPIPSSSSAEPKDSVEHSGYNSGDEYNPRPEQRLTDEEWRSRDMLFSSMMTKQGLKIKETTEDGACLFRAISDQIYGDQDMHSTIRQNTMDYISQNRDYFAQYVTEDFNSYVSRKRRDNVHGNHVEIQAVSEMYNRPVEVYIYSAEPALHFNATEQTNGCEPLRLSYHRGSHYNSVVNPWKATVGVGLGLAGYRPGEADIKQLNDAVRQSEDSLIEQTMLEDKLKATDWEATNEAIEEQVARESYLQWCRDNEMRKKRQTATSASSSSTITSTDPRCSPRSRSTAPLSPHVAHCSKLISLNSPKSNSPKSPTYFSSEESAEMDIYCSYYDECQANFNAQKETMSLEVKLCDCEFEKCKLCHIPPLSLLWDEVLEKYIVPMKCKKPPTLYLRSVNRSVVDELKRYYKCKRDRSKYDERITRSLSPQLFSDSSMGNKSPSARSCDYTYEHQDPMYRPRFRKHGFCSEDENFNENKTRKLHHKENLDDESTKSGTSNSIESENGNRQCYKSYGQSISECYDNADMNINDEGSEDLKQQLINQEEKRAKKIVQDKGKNPKRRSLRLSNDDISHNLRSRSVEKITVSRPSTPVSTERLPPIVEQVQLETTAPPKAMSPKAGSSTMSDFYLSLYQGCQFYDRPSVTYASSSRGESEELRRAMAASELEYYAQLKKSHKNHKSKLDPMGPSTSRRYH